MNGHRTFRPWAASVAHDLRTPLTALSGEVELALRRERPPEAYRAALERIAACVEDLLALSGDLAILAASPDSQDPDQDAWPLDEALAAAQLHRFPLTVALSQDVRASCVSGQVTLLGRMLALLAAHAAKHCPGGSRVRLHEEGDATSPRPEVLSLLLEAEPVPFRSDSWRHLSAESPHADGHALGLLALTTAAHIARASGGTIDAQPSGDGLAIRISLLRVGAASRARGISR